MENIGIEYEIRTRDDHIQSLTQKLSDREAELKLSTFKIEKLMAIAYFVKCEIELGHSIESEHGITYIAIQKFWDVFKPTLKTELLTPKEG